MQHVTRRLATLAGAAIIATAAGAAAAETVETTLTDAINGTAVIERFDPIFGEGSFEVFNRSGADIFMFAVSNPNNDPGSFTTRPGWTSSAIEKEDWDSPLNGIETFALATGAVFSVDGNPFESLFGATDQSALVYHNNGAANPIAAGTLGQDPLEFGFVTIAVTSDFIAIDGTGAIVAQSFVSSAVPAPAALPLLASAAALIGFAALGRRRRG